MTLSNMLGGELLILVGVGVVLLVLLFILKAALKLTKTCLGLGCLGIIVVLAGLFFLLRYSP